MENNITKINDWKRDEEKWNQVICEIHSFRLFVECMSDEMALRMLERTWYDSERSDRVKSDVRWW